VYQTGGNVNSNDSVACASTAAFATGDLYIAVGGAGKTNCGPLRSNFPDTLTNAAQNNSTWHAVFYKTINLATTFTPYMAGNSNAGRFILLANRIHAIGNPNPNPGNTLPVKLEGFTGKSKVGANTLYWNTASEINLKAFEIQRSSDGGNFKTIGTMATKSLNGNSSYAQSYSFVDAAPVAKSYYRLMMVDNDGSTTYSPTIVIDNSNLASIQLVAYPNPSNGVITLGGVESTNSNQIKVLNAFGQSVGFKVLNSEIAAQTTTIKLVNTAPGFYYVTYDANGKVMSTKVLIK
jgi:hypothetical protein